MFPEILIKSIISVNHNGKDYYPKKVEVVSIKNKFSSSKLPSDKIKINDDIILDRYDRLTYICPSCQREVSILVDKFLKKESINCRVCKEQIDTKREKQSDYIKTSFRLFNKVQKKEKNIKKNDSSVKQLIDVSLQLFEDEDDEFKKSYLSGILTKNEFEQIKPFINKIGSINIKDQNIEYIPIIKVSNQVRYSPKVLIDGSLYLLSDCEFVCQSCDLEFRGRNILNKFKNGVFCRDCNFSNKVFKFKYIRNINGDRVIYQSNPELKLINYCNSNGIVIKNGPRIPYNFGGKNRIYKVDFMIESLKILVEVKDEHIWHKNEIISGKWKSKEQSANKWCDNNGFRYYLVFNVDIFIKSLN